MSASKRKRMSRAEKRKIATRMPPGEIEEDVLKIVQGSECEIVRDRNKYSSVSIRPPWKHTSPSFRNKAVILADDEAYSRHGGNENDSYEINWSRSGTESNISN